MAPNNKAGDLSHSAQKKVNAAAKKADPKKGPAGVAREVAKKPICKICRQQTNAVKDMILHFENRHPKETFVESEHCVY